MGELNIYGWVSLVGVIVGGVCLGFLGLFDVQIITGILGHALGRLIYIAIGVGAGYLGYLLYLSKLKQV